MAVPEKKELRLAELIAIALGGMIGGGIFSILGISVAHIGNTTPIAIAVGGVLALFAAYSYVKLALYYKDEGATYSFFKRTFTTLPFSSAAIGWLIIFGYISTLALYAFTFASYLCSILPVENTFWINRIVAGLIIVVFLLVNIISVKGMGRIEDAMVYTKIILLLFISGLFAGKGDVNNLLPIVDSNTSVLTVLMVSSVTFVAFEGFQLVINAYNEMEKPQKNIPRSIYSSIIITTSLYIILSLGALATIPKESIIEGQEYALAAGAKSILGNMGLLVVIFGALLATSSAISGTLFGASRLMAVVAEDGYFPSFLSKRIKVHIPKNALLVMGLFAFVLIMTGGLQVILEFGSVTFIVVSFLMALANYKVRKQTNTHVVIAIIAMAGLLGAAILIFYFEIKESPKQLYFILGIYLLLMLGATFYARRKAKLRKTD